MTVYVLVFGSEGGRQDTFELPKQVSFPTQDGGLIYAHRYGKSDPVIEGDCLFDPLRAHGPTLDSNKFQMRDLSVISNKNHLTTWCYFEEEFRL